MPQIIHGKNLARAGIVLALILLAGCVPSSVPGPAYPQSTYAPPANNGPSGNYNQQGVSPAANNPAATAYSAPATVTTRYVDPNVMPASATGLVPPGPGAGAGPGSLPAPTVSPYDVPASPPGPPPGYTGSASATSRVVEPESTKKSDDDDKEWDISHLAPDYTWNKFKAALGWGPDEHLAKDAYDKGQALFREKKYDEAAKEFCTATWRWPDSTLEEDSMFLMGEAYFFSDQYGSAQDSYANLLKAHDNTRYLDTVGARLFAIGTYWEQLDMKTHHWPLTPNVSDKTQPIFDTIGNALACYTLVWVHDPTGPLADAALFRVGNIHFRRSEWEEAAAHYDLLRKNHPKSKYQKAAHLLELQAKLNMYQGPLFSVVPLNNAHEIAEQTLRQFPGQLGDEEQRVRQTLVVMNEQFAEREWAVAQYYDHKAEYRAAREYYKTLLEKYPRTAFAQRAQARMEEIKNEPDEPPNHFKWLTDVFGKGR